MPWLPRFLRSSRQKTLDAALKEAAQVPPALPPQPDGPDAPPESWAAALGLPVEALAGVGPPFLPGEAEVARQVSAHFDAHRPGPASFPAVALNVLELLRDPKLDAGALARAIELDMALSAGVLALANSAVFRGVSKVETLREGVARLGLTEVARLAAALSTRSLYRGMRAELELFGGIWDRLFHHAATVARAGAELTQARRLGDPDRVFLGGMLHDVGKSLALRSLGALVVEGRVDRPGPEAVERILHQLHVQIGAEAHREWGLPEGLTAIATRHHLPDLGGGAGQEELHVVRLCSAMDLSRVAPGASWEAPAEAVDSARALGLGPTRVGALRAALAEHAEWVRMLFGAAH